MLELCHPVSFMQGIRVLHLRGRRKDGVENDKSSTLISYSEEEFKDMYKTLCNMMKPGQRIYASAGSRNIKMAIRIFRERQLASEYEQNNINFYKNLQSIWISCISSTYCQQEKLWLFDCDTPEQYTRVHEELLKYEDEIKPYWYDTKNGKHCITKPFNMAGLSLLVESAIHKNPYMLWAYSNVDELQTGEVA
jgi:hypothetical protein